MSLVKLVFTCYLLWLLSKKVYKFHAVKCEDFKFGNKLALVFEFVLFSKRPRSSVKERKLEAIASLPKVRYYQQFQSAPLTFILYVRVIDDNKKRLFTH